MVTDSYEQEIVSSLALKQALLTVKWPRIIPLISLNELNPPASSFARFLEALKKVIKDK